MAYTADFETIIDPHKTRVWAWAVCDIDSEDLVYGDDISTFMRFCKYHPDTYYFHNLKFDGEFIISWLLNNGYEYTPSRRLSSKQFTAIIADTGQWYSLTIRIDTKKKVKLIDSLKILPFSVSQIAKAFSLPIQKLEIDYFQNRDEGHILTKEEREYISNDVKIVAKALKVLFSQDLTSMTQASNAMNDYKRSIGALSFKYWFPLIPEEHDAEMRKAYKGGFTYLNEKFAGKDVGEGIVLDVNSLYPSVMYNELLPYGVPIRFEGKYKPVSSCPLYIQFFTCYFELKENHIPTLQLKHSAFFASNEYIKSSEGRDYALAMTNVDLEVFMEHYNVYGIQYNGGYMFHAMKDMFKAYIDKWTDVKIKADIDGNNGMRTLAKLMLNALYGRFGLNPNCTRKVPYLKDGIVCYTKGEDETRNPIYIPMAAFITAYARRKTITSAQSVYDRFIYADTDSLHLLGKDLPDLEIHDTKLGAWKHESTFSRAKFLRQKCYIERWVMHKNKSCYENNVTCAGLPKDAFYTCKIYKTKLKGNVYAVKYQKHKKCISFENFKTGLSVSGKLLPKHVIGGVVLFDTMFTIK